MSAEEHTKSIFEVYQRSVGALREYVEDVDSGKREADPATEARLDAAVTRNQRALEVQRQFDGVSPPVPAAIIEEAPGEADVPEMHLSAGTRTGGGSNAGLAKRSLLRSVMHWDAENPGPAQRAVTLPAFPDGGVSTPQGQERAITTATGNFPEDVELVHRLWEYMRRTSHFSRLATILRTSGGNPVQPPTVTSFAGDDHYGQSHASIIGEGIKLSAKDVTFGRAELNAWKLGFTTYISHEAMTDEAVGIMGMLRRQGGVSLGLGIDYYALHGTGASQPRGLAQSVVTSGDASTRLAIASAAAFNSDTVIDLYYNIQPQYRGNASWLASDDFEKRTRKLKDNDGQYLWQPALTASAPATLLAKPIHNEVFMDAFGAGKVPCYFGDFSHYTLRLVEQMRIERDDSVRFEYDESVLRFICRLDGVLIEPAAIGQLFITA